MIGVLLSLERGVSEKIQVVKDKIWFNFVIGRNESHKSLQINPSVMMKKTGEQRSHYLKKLIRKRDIASKLSSRSN